MRKFLVICLIGLLAAPVAAGEKPLTDDQKTLYAIGMIAARQLSVFTFSPAELEIVSQGMSDVVAGNKPQVEYDAYQDKIQELARARRKAQGETLSGVNREFLERAAKEKGAVKSTTGLIFLSLKEGTGAIPKTTDTISVNYRGLLSDGKEFESSFRRGRPSEFKLDNVIKCWAEGVPKMKVGGKARLYCPAALAYGDNGAGDLVLPGAALEFEIELLEIK
jgi:FKBP-type peptidyl-prolyl cis-trans isomerase FkpA